MTGPGLLVNGPGRAGALAPAAGAFRTPGIHLEFARARQAVRPRRTDVTGFVGVAERGPLFTPVRVEGWSEFVNAFGGHVPAGYLAYAVQAFFANGGSAAWVVRVAHRESARAAGLDLTDPLGGPSVRLQAVGPGRWAHRTTAAVAGDGARFDLTLRDADGRVELWRDLALDGPRGVVAVLGAEGTGSRLVTAELPPNPALPAPSGPRPLAGGADGLADLTITDLVLGIDALEAVDEVALLAAPDLQAVPRVPPLVTDPPPHRCDVLDDPGSSDVPGPPEPEPAELPPPLDVAQGQAALVAQCERSRDRFAVLDPPLEVTDVQAALEWRATLGQSPFAAAYFPWVLVPDPLRTAGEPIRPVPPCGHVTGVYARVDRTVGVHRAPADQVLELAADVAAAVDDVRHGDANTAGLNIVRTHPGRGIRVAGARTLAGPPWRFVNVRRLVTMIEEAVDEDLGWVVFEPNGPDLWAEVTRSVTGLLDELWRAGMLDGGTAAEAFEVRCDAGTNPPDQADLGRLTCLVALRPVPPAEFVVVRVTLSAETAGVGGSRG